MCLKTDLKDKKDFKYINVSYAIFLEKYIGVSKKKKH